MRDMTHAYVTWRTPAQKHEQGRHESQPTRGKSPLFAVQIIHVTHEWDTDESRHVLLGHVTYECVVTSHMNVSCIAVDTRQVALVCCTNDTCHMWIIHVRHRWVTSRLIGPCHIWLCRDVTYECVVHRSRRAASRPCVLCKWVLSHVNESVHM